MDTHRLRAAEEALEDLLGPQLAEIAKVISNKEYLIEIPDTDHIDLGVDEVASLVARTSNNFGRIARFAGMARAEAKLAKGRYERKVKRMKGASGLKNEAERDAYAMEHCESEHAAMVTAEAIAEMTDSMELAARIASESARKILDKVSNMSMASQRESKGYFKEGDFRTY